MNERFLILEKLSAQSNPIRARQMEAYLRNQFTFYGVMSGPRKEILKSMKTQLNRLSPNQKRELVLQLWNEKHRECQLFAIDWMMKWPLKEIVETDLDLFEKLILEKSWWDSVDGIAPNMVGKYAKKFPVLMDNRLASWTVHESFWIRRTCLIYQLRYRNTTDLQKLNFFIHDFKSDKEFFIQKAIGWSLREVSKWNPLWVSEVVNKENLVGLAKREATKYI